MTTCTPQFDQRAGSEDATVTHPHADRLPGWRFKVTFRSPGCFYAEGVNASGRKVGANGTELEQALQSCVRVAMQHDERAAARADRDKG